MTICQVTQLPFDVTQVIETSLKAGWRLAGGWLQPWSPAPDPRLSPTEKKGEKKKIRYGGKDRPRETWRTYCGLTFTGN